MLPPQIILCASALFLLLAVLINPCVLVFVSSDGQLHSGIVKSVCWTFSGIFLANSLCLLYFSRRPLATNLLLAFVSFIVGGSLFGEILFRVMILSGSKKLLNPAMYFDPDFEDEFWIYEAEWSKKSGVQNATRVHSLLGWSQRYVSDGNPFGLLEATQFRLMRDGKPKVLIYGDSFIAPDLENDQSIPFFVRTSLEGIDVLNLGVGGYGLDQIFLMFRETHRLVDSPSVTIGVLLDDVNRSILSIRSAQKPRFSVDSSGRLFLRNVPIQQDSRKFLQEAKPWCFSYLYRYVLTRFRFALAYHGKKSEIVSITRALLAEFAKECSKTCRDLQFLLFYRPGQFLSPVPDWRETLLKEELSRLRIPYLDSKVPLSEYLRESKQLATVLYRDGDDHHSALANRVIGEFVASRMKGAS